MNAVFSPRCRARGFTLIELLVVVAIIALLISILLPSLNRARDQARTVHCASILRQLGVAHHMYADSSNGFYNPFHGTADDMSRGLYVVGGFWGANRMYRDMLGQAQDIQESVPELVCPVKDPVDLIEAGQWYRAYAMNAMGSPRGETWPLGRLQRSIHRPTVSRSQDRVQMVDAVNWIVGVTSEANPDLWRVHGDRTTGGNIVAYRHLDEHANILWFDSRVTTETSEDAWLGSRPELRPAQIVQWDPYAP